MRRPRVVIVLHMTGVDAALAAHAGRKPIPFADGLTLAARAFQSRAFHRDGEFMPHDPIRALKASIIALKVSTAPRDWRCRLGMP